MKISFYYTWEKETPEERTSWKEWKEELKKRQNIVYWVMLSLIALTFLVVFVIKW